MIRFLMLFGMIVVCVNSYAQINTKKIATIKFSSHNYHRINDTLYAGEFEVTNKDYKIFLQQLSADEYERCKVDSSQWIKGFSQKYDGPMSKNYHSHSAFDSYPVVNISHYGALKYCEWLTTSYQKKNRKNNFIFKLPTDREFVLLSNQNSETKLPYNLLTGLNSENCYLENIKTTKADSTTYSEDGGFYTVKVISYWPSNFGLCNVIGNVAEMTDVDGVQKGGSWDDYLKDCLVDKAQHYSAPDPRVGFRVVLIVSKK